MGSLCFRSDSYPEHRILITINMGFFVLIPMCVQYFKLKILILEINILKWHHLSIFQCKMVPNQINIINIEINIEINIGACKNSKKCNSDEWFCKYFTAFTQSLFVRATSLPVQEKVKEDAVFWHELGGQLR